MHVEGIHNQLLRPLVGKTEDDIPQDTRAAVEAYTVYVGMALIGNRCLIHDYRRIGRGLQRLNRPRMNEYGRFRRWLHSREIEGDIRMVIDLIRLDTEAHMVSSTTDMGRIVYSPVCFGIDRRNPAVGTRSAPTRRSDPTRGVAPKGRDL